MSSGPLGWEPSLPADEPRPAGLPPFATRAPSRGGILREIPVLVAAAVVVAFVLRTFLFQAFYIPSPSMGCEGCPVETLVLDDKILVSKLAYRLHGPRRGDIVVFECPVSPVVSCNNREPSTNGVGEALRWVGERVGLVPPSTEDYVKRVVALEGEVVEIDGGIVWINGRPLEEPYLPRGLRTEPLSLPQPYVVPPDSVLVLGDNRPNSSDGRRFQAIPTDTIVGRAVLRFSPLDRIGFL
ncbi:MAG TPA: signal peptidase I [Acidimicrobiales bacterium]|nr:signal peptidase I [Acidimicrobiales bacterium]